MKPDKIENVIKDTGNNTLVESALCSAPRCPSHGVLVHSGCRTKIPQVGWFINSRNLFLTVLEAEIRVPVWLSEGPLPSCRLLVLSSSGRRG